MIKHGILYNDAKEVWEAIGKKIRVAQVSSTIFYYDHYIKTSVKICEAGYHDEALWIDIKKFI